MIATVNRIKKSIKDLKHSVVWLKSLPPIRTEKGELINVEADGLIVKLKELENEVKKFETTKRYKMEYEEVYGYTKQLVGSIKESIYGKEE